MTPLQVKETLFFAANGFITTALGLAVVAAF